MRDTVEIGLGKSGRRAYHLRELSIVPSRRTRGLEDVSTAWQIDAFRFDIPLVAHPSDATMSPTTVAEVGRLGGLGVLNVEGLWTRYEDPLPVLERLAGLSSEASEAERTRIVQQAYGEPVKPDLVTARVKELRDSGGTVAVRVSPQHTEAYAGLIVAAGADLLVVQGTIVSAEHVANGGEPLNLKTFIASLDIPVIAGGCTNYMTALHLMRTGAAGVIVGFGADLFSTTDEVLGIRVPMATAIADAAAARRDYLDETGGRYVHVIADGEIESSGDVARALACGADAVMVGQPLAAAAEAPAGGVWWHTAAAHPKLPRGAIATALTETPATLEQILHGPSTSPLGDLNLFGALRRVMAKTGYKDLKEFQKVEIVVTPQG